MVLRFFNLFYLILFQNQKRRIIFPYLEWLKFEFERILID